MSYQVDGFSGDFVVIPSSLLKCVSKNIIERIAIRYSASELREGFVGYTVSEPGV